MANHDTESRQAAREAGLRYLTDDRPGIRRRRRGHGWSYLDASGRPIRDRRVRARIDALAIPPAWTNVWISPLPNGHLQATGRDQRGRKQYRYHENWSELSNQTKYHRMLDFGRALPRIRRVTGAHLRLPGLPREKVLAAAVRLLQGTGIRVGNAAYTRENHSYGLTTLRRRHVGYKQGALRIRFRGKSGQQVELDVEDRRLVRVVRNCADLPGHELFKYLDDAGEAHTIDSADVNDYIREIAGGDFTAKDFRTWLGTCFALQDLLRCGAAETATARRAAAVAAVKFAAMNLRNRPATCRKYYVAPAVLGAYEDGSLFTVMGGELRRRSGERGLRKLEVGLLRLLERYERSAAAA